MRGDDLVKDRETGQWVEQDVLDQKREKRRQTKASNGFVQYNYEAQLQLAKSSRNCLLAVLAELYHLHFKSWDKSAPIALGGSTFLGLGFHRTDKTRALKDLENAGWIKVDWRNGKSPLVTIVKGFHLHLNGSG